MNILSQKELDHLASVIKEVEKTTSGELRLMIVKRSTFSSYLFRMLWLFISMLGLLILWQERHAISIQGQSLEMNEPWWLLFAVFAGSALIAWGLSGIEWLQRLLIPKFEMSAAVFTRAELEFYREGLDHTHGGTGILIFLSLFEHQAVVLGDKNISDKLKPETWNEVVGHVIAGGKTGAWDAQLEKAIRLCGKLLSQHFPLKDGDKNELPNHVIVRD